MPIQLVSIKDNQIFNAVVTIFGVSMAGACVGFLVHNHHKATVFMGDTGSLALGGALAAMASSTGLFLPLFICSGVFFIETVSVILQVSCINFFSRTYTITSLRFSPFVSRFPTKSIQRSVLESLRNCSEWLLSITILSLVV